MHWTSGWPTPTRRERTHMQATLDFFLCLCKKNKRRCHFTKHKRWQSTRAVNNSRRQSAPGGVCLARTAPWTPKGGTLCPVVYRNFMANAWPPVGWAGEERPPEKAPGCVCGKVHHERRTYLILSQHRVPLSSVLVEWPIVPMDSEAEAECPLAGGLLPSPCSLRSVGRPGSFLNPHPEKCLIHFIVTRTSAMIPARPAPMRRRLDSSFLIAALTVASVAGVFPGPARQ